MTPTRRVRRPRFNELEEVDVISFHDYGVA